MSGISFGGLVSGLDTGSIVSQLVALRQRPIARLEQKKSDLNRSLAALNDLKAALAKLDTASRALDTEGEFDSKTGRSADENVFTATANSSTPNGLYQVRVDRLAQTHRTVSQSYATTDVSLGAGDVAITIGGQTSIVTIEPGADTLADLKFAINEAGLGVTATLVNDGTGHRLLIGADESGSANQFTVDVSGLGGGTLPVFTVSTTGQDAQITLDDSIVVTSSTNTVTDAIEGLKLVLRSEGTAELAVEGDTTALAEKIEAFADAYNGVIDLLAAQDKNEGALANSPLARTVRSRLSSTMTARIDTGGTFGVAADIGLSLDRFGRMTFDASKLDTAIEQDYESVLQLFIASSTEPEGAQGIATAIKTAVDGINASSNGLIRFRRDAISDEIERIDVRIDRDTRALELYAQALNRKFTAMEQTIARLQAQSGYLM